MENPPQEHRDAVIVARVNGPHGRDGALSVELFSDLAGRFDIGRELLADGNPHTITASRRTGSKTGLLWFEGISTRRQAAPLAGKYLAAPPDTDAILEEGEYFHYQLIGLQVRTEDGENLGELQEIIETGSNDVYIVRGATGELLIPAIANVVRHVDLTAGSMMVRLPGGLR